MAKQAESLAFPKDYHDIDVDVDDDYKDGDDNDQEHLHSPIEMCL